MGAEAIWIPLAMSALGAGINYTEQRKVAKRQDNILAGQIQQNSARQAEADRAVSDTLRNAAASTSEDSRGSAAAQYLDQVRAAQAGATRGLGQVGAVSGAYQQAANDAALGVGDYAAQTANLMARIDAPAQQRQQEAQSSDRLRSELGLIGRKAAGDDYLAQLRLRNVRANPWAGVAAQLMGGAAQGMAGRTAGTGGMSGAAAGSTQNFGNNAGNWFSDPSLWRSA